MKPEPIVPAHLDFRDGIPYSDRFGDVYWSSHGGLEETRHVFLQGNQLPQRWMAHDTFVILETGFGAGLNFLATWQAWSDSGASGRLHYVSLEKHPFRADDLARLHADWPQLRPLSAALLRDYPPPLPGFHRLHLDSEKLTLTLLWGDAVSMLSQLQAQVDAFFLDGFAPDCNPDMWSETVCAQLARVAGPGATLATYSVAGSVRRALQSAGFVLEKRPGYGRKREMLCGRLAASWATGRQRGRRAAIIGAGLAGAECADRLAQRGWHVTVIERREAPARETSGNPAGLVQPVPSLDWNRLSRISFAGFGYSVRQFDRLESEGGVMWQRCGVLRLARDATHAAKQARIALEAGIPPEIMRFVSMEEAAQICGARVEAPGWWFPDGCWVHPASLCVALLKRGGERVKTLFEREVAELEALGNVWRIKSASGRVIDEAEVVVLANGYEALRIPQTSALPLRPVRGQITCIPASPGRLLRTAVAREGYVTPVTSFGVQVVGATYQEGSTDQMARMEDHQENLSRLAHIVPDFARQVDPLRIAGRAGIRTVGPDRLPLVGALPLPIQGGNQGPPLYGLLGLGSRGLVFAPLAAELLASQLAGEPLPLEMELVAHLDPARVLRLKSRR